VHLRSFTYKPWRDLRGRWLDVGLWGEILRQTKADLLARADEAEAVAALLERETDPFLLCGDFNSTPHNWEYGRLGRGLTDAFAAAGSGRGATYHAHARFARIDFILASPAWRVVSARVAEAPLSDHLPVIAEFALR